MSITANELLAVMGARALKDDTTVFVGVGAPLMAAALAQRTHAPKLTMVIEGGIVGPSFLPGELPISTNEMRTAYHAQMLPGITDAFLLAQRGFLDVASSAAPRSTSTATSTPAPSAATTSHRSGCRAAGAPTTSSRSVAR